MDQSPNQLWVYLHEARREKFAAHLSEGLKQTSHPSRRTVLSQLPLSTMKADSQRRTPKEREADLNAAIEVLDLAKISSILPAKAVLGSVTILLKTIRVCLPPSAMICSRFTSGQDSMIEELDYVELGLSCANVCRTLDQRTNGMKQDELSPSVYDVINQLTLSVKQTILISNHPLRSFRLQDGGRCSEEASQMGRTEYDISTFSREGRQRNYCHLEVGPRQDSSGPSRAFCRSNGGHR